MLITGILRGVFANTKSGPKNNKMPYVFTNPPKDTELFTCDKVFILSQTNMTQNKILKVCTVCCELYCVSSVYSAVSALCVLPARVPHKTSYAIAVMHDLVLNTAV